MPKSYKYAPSGQTATVFDVELVEMVELLELVLN